MAIIKGKGFLRHEAYRREALRYVKQRYKITKVEFEILCICNDLQQPKEPYFFIPDLVDRLRPMLRTDVYNYIKELSNKGHVKMSHETPKRSQPNYYLVTGQGEAVLRVFITRMTDLLS